MKTRIGRGLGLTVGLGVLACAAVADAGSPIAPISPQQRLPVGQAVDLETGLSIGAIGATVTFRATLREHANGAPLAGQTVTFKVDGAAAGTGTTDANGLAVSKAFAVPNSFGIGDKTIEASFAGSPGFFAATSKNNLDVVKSATRLLCDVMLGGGYATGHPFLPGDNATVSCELTRITDNAKLDGRLLHLKLNGVALKDTATVSGDVNLAVHVPNAALMTTVAGFDGDALYLSTAATVKTKVQSPSIPVYVSMAPPVTTRVGDTVVFTLFAGKKAPAGPGLAPADPVAGMGLAVVYDSAWNSEAMYGHPADPSMVPANFGTAYTNDKGVATLTVKMQHAGVGSVRPFLEDDGNAYKYSWANYKNTPELPFAIERANLNFSVTGPASGHLGQSLAFALKANRTSDGAGAGVPFTSNFGNGATATNGLATLTVPLPSTMGVGAQTLVVKIAETVDYNSGAASHAFTVSPSQN